MPIKIAINGFGRIGRCIARIIFQTNQPLELAAINSGSDAKDLAYCFKYDSVHGIFSGEVEVKSDYLLINGKKIATPQIKTLPESLPWRELDIQMVLECTGVFDKGPAVAGHIRAGAKKVILAAPGEKMDGTFVYGVNHKLYDPGKHHVISNASCTTNCLAPLVKVIHENFGIEHGLMTTAHSYTMDQRLLDGSHKDLRRGRAAARSIVPTSTGAATTVGEVIPELSGHLDGLALRIPTLDVSMVDFTAVVKKSTSEKEVNQAFVDAAQGSLKNILDVSYEPLVSVDFTGSYFSAILDAPLTKVMNGTMVKVMAWYDNEMGFAHRMVDMTKYIGAYLD